MQLNQRGFTLIELIVVITIVGILAAVALPRFINAQQDARVAKAQAIAGSLRSASALARSRCELDLSGNVGACTAAAGTVSMDGANNVTMVNKFPAAAANGIDVAAQINVTSDGLTAAAGVVGTCNGRVFRINGAPGTTAGANTCAVCYQAATAAAGAVVDLAVTNC